MPNFAESFHLGGQKIAIDHPTGDGLAAVRAVWPFATVHGSLGHFTYLGAGSVVNAEILAEAWPRGRTVADGWWLRIKPRTPER